MKIRTKLSILAFLPLLLLALVGLQGIMTFRSLSAANDALRLSDVIENCTFRMGILTYEYLRHHEERPTAQWLVQCNRLEQALGEAEGMALAQPLVSDLKNDLAQLSRLFQEMLDLHRRGGERTSAVFEERERRMAAALLSAVQSAYSRGGQLEAMALKDAERGILVFLAVSLALIVSTGTAATVVAAVTSKNVAASLHDLHLAADRMAAGDLDFQARTGTDDEHGQLARALNEMARRLKTTQHGLLVSEKLSAIGTLAAGVAHELNNPMMGVMNYVGYARGLVGDGDAARTLEKAEHELERMRDLLKNMLAFAHPLDEPISALDLTVVVGRAVDLVAPACRAMGIRLETRLPEGLPEVMGKPGGLQQVFVNLLTNARDAVQDSAVKEITVSASAFGDTVVVEVTDTGHGVPKELGERVFDPFVTTKPVGKGTGLGLSIARNIVTDLGGSITFSSRPGGGTTFSALFPARQRTGGAFAQGAGDANERPAPEDR